MQPIETLLNGLLPFVPDCPEPVALHWLRDSAARLCSESGIWKALITLPVKAGQVAVPIAVPAGAAIANIKAVTFNGEPLEPKADVLLDEAHPNWLSGVAGKPFCYGEGASNAITPFPTADGTLTLRCTLKPSMDATELPGSLINDWGSIIQAGALMMLYLQPDKPWSNPSAAGTQASLFEQGVREARHEATHGKQDAPIRTKPHFF
ncbi:phage adaptor protein [Chitinimonas sp. PSY-7]|uniref:phage adaptor protein n=1 Tax=Chitinimonas sp. PSY-7 TaxID=3459088 RepID=UPI0040400A8A